MADKNEAMENLFKAIDIITAERLTSLGYDKTIKATITDDTQSAQGRYTLTDGSSSFEASCNPETIYKKDMMVYVVIPEGDWNNEKLIVGRYSNKGDDYYNYANPSDDFLDITHNLISDVDAKSLLANNTDRPYVQVWSVDDVEYKGYNRLALKGNFRTWLSPLDVMKGTYGLVLYVVSKESRYDTGDFERTYKFDLFTSDMYGDPFNFETYYLQEKVFDISGLSNIVHMELLLVQNSDFYNVENELVAYKDSETEEYFPDNIFVQSPYVSLGYDLNDVVEDDVRLYTLDAETYDATYDENRRQKTMNVRWIHIQEDGVPKAIDLEEEIPANSVVRWYKYVLDRAVADKLAGALWEEIEEARNTFSYSFVPDLNVASEKFKVIVESPSREAIIAQLKESEFGNFSATDIEDKEGQKTTDYEVLQNALYSYNDNSLLSFQEYKQIIEEHNKKWKAKEGVNYKNYEQAILILDNIQRAQSNVCIYKSEILEFENESYDPVAAAIDLISGLEILVDPVGYNGSYLLYDESGMITNAAEAVRKRTMAATYQSLITGEEILDKAEKIVWYFPIEGSMIYPPQLGTEYTDYEVYSELTDEEIAALELPCKYCRIERAVPEVLEGDAGDEVARQTEQIFRIQDFYTQTATNNTIYCTVFKNGKQYKAESTLVFGTSGTCGTDATFLLQMMEWDEENQKPTTHPVSALTIGKSVAIVPRFYDYNRNDITEEYLGSHSINYAWDSQEASGEGALQLSSTDVKPTYARVWVDSGAGIEKCQYYILKASVSWSIVKYMKDEDGKVQVDADGNPMVDEQDENLETRDVRLTTFLPIPVRTSDEFTQAVGPTQIIYNKDGANPAYYNSPFVLYKNGEPIEASWMSQCREYLKSNPKDTRILNYYPSLDAEGNLTPKSMYLSEGKPYAVEAIVDGNVVWTQPILIIKNKYASAMLNAWDGELCIDKENGTIMATMVGAGKKEEDNTFSGVLMGDVAGGAGFDERNHKGMGLYGFNHGEQSFGFNIDGTAFIGKAGRGRINLNGNKGTIESGSYTKNVAGMQIDLDGDETDKTASALYAYGGGGAIELDTNDNKPLFVVRSTPAADGKKLIFIGRTDTSVKEGEEPNRDFYIQSENYVKDIDGTHINLKTGKIYIYNKGNKEGETPSYIRIDGDGSPYLQIHDGQTSIRAEGTDVFYASKSKYQLMSVNYKEGEAGIYINLQGGTIEARKGNIGGWAIEKNKISAGNIELRAEGSMYGGSGDNTWYIDKDGKASFQNLSVTDSGTIGPFTVSDTALTYKSGLTFTLSDTGLNLNSAFTVDRSGNTLIAGTLHVKGATTLDDTLTVQGGKIVAGGGGSGGSGGGGGGGYYTLNSTGGNIGPWTIDKTGIYTGTDSSTANSFLGSTGNMWLSNTKCKLDFTDAGFKLSHTDGGYLEYNAKKTELKNSEGDYLLMNSSKIEMYQAGAGWIHLETKNGGELRVGNDYQSWFKDAKGSQLTLNEGMAFKSAEGKSSMSLQDASIGLVTTDCSIGISKDNGFEVFTGDNSLSLTSDSFAVTAGETSLSIDEDNLKIDGKNCSKNRKVTISWWGRTPYFMVYKGLVIDDSTTDADGEAPDDTVDGFGDLAFLDEVVISSANFKIGSSKCTVTESSVDGDTATYKVTIPGQSYSAGSSGSKTVYAFKNSAGNVYLDTDSTPLQGYTQVDSLKVTAGSGGSGTTDARTLTVTLEVAAQKKST
jgi:hypothetical protein